jgi:hypothetical protein
MNKSNMLSFGCVLLMVMTQVNAAPSYETHIGLNASEILSKKVLTGSNHQVNEKVINDGYLNIYTINSKYGDIEVTSTDKLKKYVNEINAIARMDAVKGSDEFKKGLSEKVGDVMEGASGLLTDPVDTVGGAISGVGKLFSRGAENLTGGSRSDAEGSRMADLTGFSSTKRGYAYDFGVDVYSRNTLMQEHLDALVNAGHLGTLSMSVLLMAVPGGAGTAVSVAGSTTLMNNVFRDSAPADLRKMNRAKLKAMGVNQDIIDLFIANGIYSPREQTLIVAALDSMKGTKDINSYIKFSVLTDNEDVAFFRQRQAQMYAEFHNKVKPIGRFISVGQSSAGVTKDGTLIFNAPLDHLLWTEGIANLVMKFESNLSSLGDIKKKEMYLTGAASELAKKSLHDLGWKVYSQTK